jgi:bifunctional DNA-binding transcriptional regulator/antitoxin component of YhaV-PrlF toxin-antitoxin module
MLTRLGWRPGDPVTVDVVHRTVMVVAGAGRHALGCRGDLALPAAVRQLWGIRPHDLVIVAGYPARNVIVIHPLDPVTALLAEFHTHLVGDRNAR